MTELAHAVPGWPELLTTYFSVFIGVTYQLEIPSIPCAGWFVNSTQTQTYLRSAILIEKKCL